MNRVFLPEPNRRFQLEAAAAFGPLVYVTDGVNPYNTAGTALAISDGLKAKRFNPANDYLCLTGHTLPVAMLLSVATAIYGPVKLLMFESRDSTYRERIWDPKQVAEQDAL